MKFFNYIKLNQIFEIIEKFSLSNFILLNFIIFLVVFLEVLSVGMVIPLITVLLDKNLLISYFDKVVFLNQYLINADDLKLVIVLTFLFVYFIKFVSLIFLNFYQFSFSTKFQANISNFFSKKYLYMEYETFFQKNSSVKIKNIIIEASNFVYGVLLPLIYIFTEILVIFSLLILVMLNIGSDVIYILISLIVFASLYLQFTKNSLSSLGKNRDQLNEKILKNTTEAFDGIKEIKISNNEKLFKTYLSSLFNEYSNVLKLFFTIQSLPRLTLEILFIIIFCFLILIFDLKNNDANSTFVTLGILGSAAIRLLPSSNKILSSLQNIRFYHSSVKILLNELKIENYKLQETKKIDFNTSIKIKNLSFGYGKKRKILKNINFNINKGDKIAITGESGAGKSTLINVLTGLLKNYSGRIYFDQQMFKKKMIYNIKNAGYVSQKPFLFNDTVLFNITFKNQLNEINKKNLKLALNKSDCESFVNKLPKKVLTNVGQFGTNFSVGQVQRIGIARALYNNPKLLILDEAFSNLDEKSELKIVKKLYIDKDLTIVNIAHKGISLNFCKKTYQIKNKKILIKK